MPEIVGFARAMRRFAAKVEAPENVVDTCGTGGDAKGTINVSTAAAFVARGAGVVIAKHGNRAATSQAGSADVLEALGAEIELEPEQVSRCIAEAGIGFMFARTHHPAMRFVAPVRAELPFRTVFNLLGPLTNPAGARRQLVGVFGGAYVRPVAEALRNLGAEKALVVHGTDGMDEITVTDRTLVADVSEGGIDEYEISPEDFGLSRHAPDGLLGGDAHLNARILRDVLTGEERGAARDVVLLNAGAAIHVSGNAETIEEGVGFAKRFHRRRVRGEGPGRLHEDHPSPVGDRMRRATVLDELATAAVRRAEVLRSSTDLTALYQEALLFEKRDFAGALSAPGLSVVSEIKRASPSAGFIREADPAEWGARYESEGANCISVLTEPERFEGSLEDLDAARTNTTLPVLRKDFTVYEAQILEPGTRADAVLLIAALFEAAALARYVSLAVELGLTPLVEIHDEEEANLALESGASVIGINNRNLRDFTVDLATFERLAPELAGATLVAESGIKNPEDARRLRNAGADAVLVGEAAMRDPGLIARLASLP